MIRFTQARNSSCHTDIRSATNQVKFIQTIVGTSFEDDLKPVVSQMLSKLEGLSFKRMD